MTVVSQAQSSAPSPGELTITTRRSKANAVAKRAFDLLVSTGLLCITSPALPLIAVIIKLDSKGPVFYLQERVGEGRKPFNVVKLRSMHEAEHRAKPDDPASHDDDAVTRVGHYLRRFSLDELPQLINVFRGQMSFVGPRPFPESGVDFNNSDFVKSLSARPGLTSPGTIEWRKTGHELSFEERTKIDAEYEDCRNVFKDFIVLIQSIGVLFKGR